MSAAVPSVRLRVRAFAEKRSRVPGGCSELSTGDAHPSVCHRERWRLASAVPRSSHTSFRRLSVFENIRGLYLFSEIRESAAGNLQCREKCSPS